MQLWKLGCRWSSNSPLFYDYLKEKSLVIGVANKKYKIDDWLLITDGMKVLALAKVLNSGDSVINLNGYEDDFNRLEIPFDNFLFVYKAQIIELKLNDQFRYNLQKGIVRVQKQEIIDIFLKIKNKYDLNKTNPSMEILNLLKYKKQIILQGPPGTGKTRLAKEIAGQLIEVYENSVKKIRPLNISKQDILQLLKVNDVVLNKSIVSLGFSSILLDGGVEIEHDNVISAYAQKKWTNAKKEKAVALAQKIYHRIGYNIETNKIQPDIRLIQFHPSYTYEDFVRGIVSKPNVDGDGIIYEAENKILGEFAKQALDNYLASKQKVISNTNDVSEFESFIEYIKDEIAQSELHKYDITEAVYLFDADEKRFKYKGDNWKAHAKGLNMKFSELRKIIDSGAKERQDIKKMSDLEELTRQHATYFIKLVEKFHDYKFKYKDEKKIADNVELKNYVLIIDEINRANLSSVLGELIYALEYRGEAVESMYAIDGDNKLILPPNLYIIGTMNTADRSVGHIDYAIRRRFAFVDVLPKDLSGEEGIAFDQPLFNQVSELFDKNLSPEFKKKEVQLGHSYFIDKSKLEEGVSMSVRLEFEIRPILLEYVKDGVLIGENIESQIENLVASI